jgi:peroxiredoxin
VQFIGVAWYGADESFQGFISKHGLTFPQVADDPGDVFARFGVPSQPALAVVRPDGSVEQYLGAVEPDQLAELFANA